MGDSRASSFGAEADSYEAARPDYPFEAVAWMLECMPEGSRRLADEDASVDAVVLGQAWHWVDPVTASAEIGRVVRSGGTLGLIWNARDGRVDWVRRLTAIMRASAAEEMLDAGGPTVAPPFGSPDGERWEWRRPMTRAQLHRMAASRSHLITASESERASIRRGMDDLFDELGLDEESSIDVPYVTWAFRALRG